MKAQWGIGCDGRSLIELAEQAEDDQSVLMLAITGAVAPRARDGAGASFCAGFDDDVDPRLVRSLAILSKPTLAIVNGDALDEGSSCRSRSISAWPTRARVWGSHNWATARCPSFGGTQRLPRLVGGGHALRRCCSPAPRSTAQAMRLGLVGYVARESRELPALVASVTDAILSRGPLRCPDGQGSRAHGLRYDP